MVNEAVLALDWYLKGHPKNWQDASSVLAIRPVYHELLEGMREKNLRCLQSYFPDAEGLRQNELEVITKPSGSADLVICFGTKFKDENLYHLALSHEMLEPGGKLIFAIGNKSGARSLQKYIAPIFEDVRSASKHHCKIYVAQKSENPDADILAEYQEKGQLQTVDESDFKAYSGNFSTKRLDPGSVLLAEALPNRLKGKGADLGAGYGVLSKAVLQKEYPISAFHLYEAENRALEAARHNLEGLLPEGLEVTFNWANVMDGLQHRHLDWIVMNPPFHAGKIQDVSIGEAFVKVAADSLRRKGQLFMVANRHLPYEKLLVELFESIEVIAENNAFKVFRARK